MFGQNGEGALRHGPVTDKQNFIFEFQHGKFVLARHFVQIFFRLQEFIEKTHDTPAFGSGAQLDAPAIFSPSSSKGGEGRGEEAEIQIPSPRPSDKTIAACGGGGNA
jgi:hypothetical protein